MKTNESGLTPIEYNILVKQDAVEEKTPGGLMMPQTAIDKERHAQTLGTIIALSPMAFAFDDWPSDTPTPDVGQRIVFSKHAGVFVEGKDGEEYRVIKDKDVVAMMET